MNKFVCLVLAAFLTLGLSGWSCTSESSDAKEQSAAGTDAAAAYAALQQELQGLQTGVTTQQQMGEALEKSIEKLDQFARAYPGSKEAGDAVLQLAMIHAALGQFDKAVPRLEGYLETAAAGEEATGYAHFYLAESYKSVDRFDDAQKHYQIFIDEYSDLSPRVTTMAKTAIQDIPAMKRLAVGQEPIPFSVKDTAGKTLSLEKYDGKVVLLDFWASWCMPCRVEMPNVIRIYKKFNEKGFEIIGISLDSDKKAFESYVETNKMTWPQYFDGKGWQNDVAAKYKVQAIPATYLIDKQGKIRYRSLRGEDLEKAIEKLLAEA